MITMVKPHPINEKKKFNLILETFNNKSKASWGCKLFSHNTRCTMETCKNILAKYLLPVQCMYIVFMVRVTVELHYKIRTLRGNKKIF